MDALPEVQLLRPKSVNEVLAARVAHPQSQLLGGGTDLVVNIRRGIVAPPVLIDMNDVAELRAIKADERGIELGASATLTEVARHAGVFETLPGRGAGGAGSSRVRRSATWVRSVAISVSTRAASSTIRANGGAPPTITASRPRATFAMWRRRAAAYASPPSAATSRRRCSRSAPKSISRGRKAAVPFRSTASTSVLHARTCP